MRAAVYHAAGDVRIEAVAGPGEPGPGEALVAPTMAAICGTDASEYSHGSHMIPLHERHPGSGHVGPLILGHEFVGRVEALGDGVEGLAVGDRVVPGAGVSCGECGWCQAGRTNLCAIYYTLGLSAAGGLADQVLSPASICVPVPDQVNDVGAAMAQPLASALGADEAIDARQVDVDAALREVDLIAIVAHICDSNLPESLRVLAATGLAGEVLGEVVPMTRLVADAIAPLAAGTAPGKMVVEVAA
jgi:threonine dehydrogenase-like Zn-dependent dehydrogenase